MTRSVLFFLHHLLVVTRKDVKKKISRLQWSCVFSFFLFSGFAIAQNTICPNNTEIDQLLQKANLLSDQGKSAEAIEDFVKAGLVSKSVNCEKGLLEATRGRMMIYYQKYDYEKALEVADEVKRLALKQKDYTTLSIVSRTVAIFYENLGLLDQSSKEYDTALKYAMLIADTDTRYYHLSIII